VRRPAVGVVAQPGASVGQRVYCPVSGVVLEVTAQGAHRDRPDGRWYFCCEPCAVYFTRNEQAIRAARSA
jgi:YHS domain-containing protein